MHVLYKIYDITIVTKHLIKFLPNMPCQPIKCVTLSSLVVSKLHTLITAGFTVHWVLLLFQTGR